MSDGGFPEGMVGLERILDNGIGWMQDLKAALIDERDALERRDAQQLAQAAQSKEALARKLSLVDRHKREIGAAAQATDGTMHHRLQAFRAIALECERLNRTNGTIIRARHRQVMDGLCVLRGRDHDEDTYTPTGNTEGTASRRMLTEA